MVSLDFFGINNPVTINNALASYLVGPAGYAGERQELGAMRLSLALESLAQKIEAIRNKPKKVFRIDEFEAGVLSILESGSSDMPVYQDGLTIKHIGE